MITSIEGRIAERSDDYVVVVVNGIGYQVFVPHSTKQKLSDEHGFLHTTLIVREDSLTLYGFATTTEREIFNQLIGVSGVGPRLALAILSTLSPDNLRMAVIQERAELLTRVPGIGKKTAQKIVFELKDKFPTGLDAVPIETFEDDINTDVIDTLLALGYSVVEAQAAVQSLPADAPENVEERVRLALQYFA
ncbi:MAG: Holliday junction branch migration protein RuvA [Chloroflexi bacterium]|nr:MAG: Holliday junction branch migration protein RuvA [Chloroflexota bacterium]